MLRSLTRTFAALLGVMALLAVTPFAWSQQIIQQSTTSRKIAFLMIDSADHITGKTGLTVTVTISKNGAAFAAPAGTVSELANGWYVLTANSADTGTLGPLLLHASATGADPVDKEFNVVACNLDDNVALGLSRIDASISSRSTYAGGDTAGTTTLLSRIPGTIQPQTGDAYARLGAPVGASISADIQTRSTYAGTDTSGVTTLLSRLGTPTGASIAADIAGVPAGVWNNGMRTLTATSDSAGITTLLGRIASNLTITSGGVTVAGYASGQDPASLVLAATVDGGFTLKQLQSLSAAVLSGNFTVTRNTGAKTITVVYYRPASPGNTTTVLATLVTSYSDSALTIPTGRAVTFSNLP